MSHVPAWSGIKDDLRVSFVLVADACRYMTDVGERGDAAASAILDIDELPEQKLDELIKDREFLGSVSVADTVLADCARHCFDLITVLGPLEEINIKEETANVHWLAHFLSFIPKKAISGINYTGTFHHPQAPLQVLLGMAQARLRLAEYVQKLVLTSDAGLGYTPQEISLLGNIDIRTVRNAMGPKGDKPIRSGARAGRGRGRSVVSSDPLDTVEWLAGRRGFHPGRLSPDWVDRHFLNIKTLEAAAALPGLVTWLNRRTTDELASVLGWPAGRVRDWIRGRAISPDAAEEIGTAARLDGAGYRKLMERLMKGPSRPLTSSKQPVAL
jgi:hypothetical protein